MKLRPADWVRVYFRSFFLQGLWTDQRGQSLGCVFTLWPVLTRFYPEAEKRARPACEHAEFFSTHPYTAGVVLGMVAGMEADHATRGKPTREEILSARKVMAGPLAAMGEAFFWSTWRPFCLVAAVGAALLLPVGRGLPLLFFVLYNGFHLYARAKGLSLGFRSRADIVSHLSGFRFQRWLQGGAWVGALSVVGALVLAVSTGGVPQGSVAVALGSVILFRKGVSPLMCLLGTGTAVMAATWVGGKI